MPQPKSLMRFVQVRRPGAEPAPSAECHDARAAAERATDLHEAWSPAVRDAIAKGDRAVAEKLLAALRKGPPSSPFARVAAAVAKQAQLNERMTVGEVRAKLKAGASGKALEELTTWAVDLASLLGFLEPGAEALGGRLAALLRGVAILRLADARAPDGCRVRSLLRGQEIRLPEIEAPAPKPDEARAKRTAELDQLRRELPRLKDRMASMGDNPDPTVAEVKAAKIPDLAAATESMTSAATAFGFPDTAKLASVQRTVDAEYARTKSAPSTARSMGASIPDLSPGVPIGREAVPYLPAPSLPIFSAEARVLGRGDLMIMRTKHLRYEPAEISHVENVLASERRDRKHTVTNTTIDTVITETQSLNETSNDLETTQHDSFDRAMETAVSTTSSLSLGVSVSGGFGPVRAGLDVGASQSSTTSSSNSTAVAYAKDVTEKASELMRASESYGRTTTTKIKIKEVNEHGFDNSAGTANITGVYRWLDKVDQAQLYNYGERLLLEFIVPEPAAQFVYLKLATVQASAPAGPLPFSLEPAELTEGNYAEKAARWDVLGLTPPPDKTTSVAWEIVDPPAKQYDYQDEQKMNLPTWGFSSYSGEIKVPDGYQATKVHVSAAWAASAPGFPTPPGQNTEDVEIAVGGTRFRIAGNTTTPDRSADFEHAINGSVPILVSSDQQRGAAVSVRVHCQRSEEAFAAWQLATYETIRRGYLDQKTIYDSAMSVQRSRQAYAAATSPDANRIIEAQELKRGCQTILTGQDFERYGSVTFPAGAIPGIDRTEARLEADSIQFFEDCFEWENLTYLLYPYQWAGRARWAELQSRSSSDPLHQAFLQAGAARVVIPVREGYERPVGRYLISSEVEEWGPTPWRGGKDPYPPIDELIADANQRPGGETPVGAPWEVVTPTTLIYLQSGPELNP